MKRQRMRPWHYIAKLKTREREARDLRQNLLAQTSDAAAQQERNRLARELHDSIKQQIFSIHMSAAATEARWDTDPQGAREALADVRRSAQEALAEMNALLQQLSPTPLEKVGLIQALRDQCEALGYRTDAIVTTEFGKLPADDAWPAGAQESVFRIAQEALSNIARHARASHVRVCLGPHESGDTLGLEIQDDGQGFDLNTVKDGMGLGNIRQRVSTLGGQIIVNSTPGQGTTIHVSIPVVPTADIEEGAMRKPDHTLNKVALAGLAGGLALIAVLFYPLYVLLPGGYVANWPAGSQVLGLALEIIAALLVIATGFQAARWAGSGSRQRGALFGALAGGVASIVCYFGIGAAAAGLVGHGELLRHGLTPAAGDNELARLTVSSVIGTLWWSYAVFWIGLLAGVGLGAAGGLLAPVATRPANAVRSTIVVGPAKLSLRSTVRLMLLPGIGFSTLILMFTVAVLPLLEGAVQRTIGAHAPPLETILPPQSVSLWPIGTAAAFYLAPLATIYFLLRDETDAQDRGKLDAAQATAIVFGLLSFGVASYLLIVSPGLAISLSSALGGVVIVTATASLTLGGGYLVTFAKVRRRRQVLGFVDHPQPIRIVALASVFWSLGMIVWGASLPLSWGMLVGLAVAAVDVALLVVLRHQPRQPSSDATTLASLRSTLSQMTSAGLGSAVGLLIPLMTTLSSGISILMLIIRSSIEMLASYSTPDPDYVPDLTLVELVHGAYLAQGRISLIAFVGTVATVGLLMAAISGIMAVIRRRLAQDVGRG